MRKHAIIIIALTVLVYAVSLSNSFVWDDYSIIVKNNFIKSWDNLPVLFTPRYLSNPLDMYFKLGLHGKDVLIGSGECSYRPIVTITYFIDYSLWRLRPFGYHLTNIIIHLINALLIYFLVNLLSRNRHVALFSGIFFALHPVNAEAVNAVAFREELLMLLFYISSFVTFVKYRIEKKCFFLFVSLCLFFLALFSKEMAITLPLIIFAYDFYFSCDLKFKSVLKRMFQYSGYYLVTAFYLWVYFLIMYPTFIKGITRLSDSWYVNILSMSKIVASYICHLVMPFKVGLAWPTRNSLVISSVFEPVFILYLAVIAGYFLLIIFTRRRDRIVSFGLLWFIICLIPVLDIIPLSNKFAFRYLYLPSVGFCMFFSMVIYKLSQISKSFFKTDSRKLAKDLIIVVILLYSVFTFAQNLQWRNNLILWSFVKDRYQHSPSPRFNLANALMKIGHLDEAISELKIAIDLQNHRLKKAKYYKLLARCYILENRFPEAIQALSEAIRLYPRYIEPYMMLGRVYGLIGEYDKAILSLNRAKELESESPIIYYNLGVVYSKLGDYNKAIENFNKALELDANFRAAESALEQILKMEVK
jgi:predicted negative regulator of RcsB-dependent stress response